MIRKGKFFVVQCASINENFYRETLNKKAYHQGNGMVPCLHDIACHVQH